MYEFLDRRYALALYNTCFEHDNVEVVLEQFKEVVDEFEVNEGILKIITNPQIKKKSKKRIFTEMFENSIEDVLLKFLLLLIDTDRILYLKEKYDQFEEIYLQNKNTVVATVTSSIPLTEEEKEKLMKALEHRYDKELILKEKIDKSILGGLVINVCGEAIDGSIKSKLDDIKEISQGVDSKKYGKIQNKHLQNINSMGISEKEIELGVEVVTAIPLSEDEKVKLTNNISKFYNKKVSLIETVDENIMGGILVKIGDDVIDGTVKDKLKYVRRDMFLQQ